MAVETGNRSPHKPLKDGEALQMLMLLGKNKVGGNTEISEMRPNDVDKMAQKTRKSIKAVSGLASK